MQWLSDLSLHCGEITIVYSQQQLLVALAMTANAQRLRMQRQRVRLLCLIGVGTASVGHIFTACAFHAHALDVPCASHRAG